MLGRLAVHAATLLRGKHKPTFAPHVDTGDFVIIINAGKVALTGNKRRPRSPTATRVTRAACEHVASDELLTKHPERVVELAVNGHAPAQQARPAAQKKLKVYAGAEHPHAAQQPVPFEIKQIAQ